jgi:hypothetical protein
MIKAKLHCNVAVPNENKMSYRERERAPLRIGGLKLCKAG